MLLSSPVHQVPSQERAPAAHANVTERVADPNPAHFRLTIRCCHQCSLVDCTDSPMMYCEHDDNAATAAVAEDAKAKAILAETPPADAETMKQLVEAFKLIDYDGNGSLTRSEVMRACREEE